MIFVFPLIFIVWKLIHKTKFRAPEEVDLVQDLDEIEEYQRNYVPVPDRNAFEKYFNKIFS